MRISDWSSDVCSSDLVRTHRFRERDGLRNEILMMPWLAVIIRPTINRGYLPRPVAMDMLHRCGPLQRVGTPRVLRSHLAKPHVIGRASCRENVCPYV